MEHGDGNQQDNSPRSGFKSFASKRFAIAAVLILLVIWAMAKGPGMLQPSKPSLPEPEASKEQTLPEKAKHADAAPAPSETGTPKTGDPPVKAHLAQEGADKAHAPETAKAETPGETHKAGTSEPKSAAVDKPHPKETDHGRPGATDPPATSKPSAQTHEEKPKATETHAAEKAHPPETPHAPAHEDLPVGVAFIDAVIQPLHHELNERFWGWRPNDIINFTDNVNHFQRGALEVTRRSTVMLSERISRTGTTAAFNPNLENAMNWLMVKADRYWFPSPESKYRESLEELEKYKQSLINGRASFYTRSDNIIPLLAAYEDLLGSCDENLVKQKEKDGTSVSYFEADNHFFYAKGVASSMAGILEAVHHDFAPTLKNRNGEELLHHAIESCRQAAALDPLLITDGDLDGIFANHRAHMAAPISHARFYIGQLIKTLST